MNVRLYFPLHSYFLFSLYKVWLYEDRPQSQDVFSCSDSIIPLPLSLWTFDQTPPRTNIELTNQMFIKESEESNSEDSCHKRSLWTVNKCLISSLPQFFNVRRSFMKTLYKPPLFFFRFFFVNTLLVIDICKPSQIPPPTFPSLLS